MNEEDARRTAWKILGEVEEFLAAKGIMVPSDGREGGEEEACLYGTEYYELEDAVVGLLMEMEAAGQQSCKRKNVPDDQAKASCEAMRNRIVETAVAFARLQAKKR